MARQLFYGLITAALLLSAFGYFVVVKMVELSDMTKKMYDHPFTVTNATRSIEAIVYDIDRNLFMLEQPDITRSEINAIRERVEAQEKEIDEHFKVIMQRYLGDIKDIERTYTRFKGSIEKHDNIFELYLDGRLDEGSAILAMHQLNKINATDIEDIIRFADNKAKEFFDASVRLREEILSLTVYTIVMMLLMIIAGGLFMIRNIIRTEDSLVKQKEELSEANARMSLAQDSAGFGVWDYDLVNEKLTWDDWMLKLYGMEPHDSYVNVDIWLAALHEDDKALTYDALNKALGGKGDYDVAFRIIRPDGEVRYLQGNGLVIRDNDGNALRMVGINYDITELVKNEEKLRQRDVQLMQQSRLAQMGEMISMIAHQWRQPLAAISATALDIKLSFELDGDNLKSEEKRQPMVEATIKSLEDIETFVFNLTTTIDDFRTFYKPNKLPVDVPLIEPIRKTLHIVSNSLESDNVKVHIACDETVKVSVFENELIQVLLNLVKNAHDNFKEKHIANGVINIECSASDHGSTLSVCDNGGGIAQDVLPRIFEPYFTTKEEKNGTGLGLYMCKTIIEEHHHGKLTVQNRDDGCCFTIFLP